MSNQNENAALQWLAGEWGKSMTLAVAAMADSKPEIHCAGAPRPLQPTDGALYSSQLFSVGQDAKIILVTPELVWRELGACVLRAAGIEEVGREDALSTYQEILGQTFSGAAQALTARLGREVTCGAKSDLDTLPDNLTGLAVSIDLQGVEIADLPVLFSVSPDLLAEILPAGASEAAQAPRPPEARPEPAGLSSISKTFDLLLGVHLPVSISFGKTHMMVKEVLKLTTGSIVELDRQVTEPVDIIVNNCIIARGEVVVVAGNYGVRVKEIVSREQRYETGSRVALRSFR